MKEITMLNPRVLALAIVATGAGAVIFLSTGQEPASSTPSGFGPVPGVGLPVAIPPSVSEVPSVHPAVPAAERVTPPSSTTPAPTTRPAPVRKQAATAPTTKAAPKAKRAASQPAPAQQQPQPAGTEPNGSGGWQLPACYQDSCVATQSAPAHSGTGTELLDGTLGLLGIANPIPGLIGGH